MDASNCFDAAIHMQEKSPPHKRCFVDCGSPFIMRLVHRPKFRFALGASNQCWLRLVTFRRDLSRHCRDPRVVSHTTTALHDMSTSPRPPSPPPHPTKLSTRPLASRIQVLEWARFLSRVGGFPPPTPQEVRKKRRAVVRKGLQLQG